MLVREFILNIINFLHVFNKKQKIKLFCCELISNYFDLFLTKYLCDKKYSNN